MTSFIGRSITYNLLYLSASNVSVIYLLPTNHSQSGNANVLIISTLICYLFTSSNSNSRQLAFYHCFGVDLTSIKKYTLSLLLAENLISDPIQKKKNRKKEKTEHIRSSIVVALKGLLVISYLR
jgi:hypothetical protein